MNSVSAAANSLLWVKVKCPGCQAAESQREQVRDQRVQWDELFPLQCKMKVDEETNVVDQFPVRLSVRAASARSAAGDFERIGVATVDLAELVGARETVRRILLESSALNAILIISVQVRQTAGDAMFRCRSMELQQGGASGGDGGGGRGS